MQRASLSSFISAGLVALMFLLCGQGAAFAQLLAVGGVCVDPQGMLRETTSLPADDLRALLKSLPASTEPGTEVAAVSSLRKISLRRLEQELLARQGTADSLPAEVRYLAGLSAVKFVLFYPESGDVILAGPAEGWQVLPSGDVVGKKSNRPVLQLDDLVIALRYAFSEHDDGSFLGCSIEPTEQGLKGHAAFVRRLAGMDGSQIPQVIDGMQQAMGPQDIHVYGVAPSSRFALETIAADYRLKRIALAHEPAPVRNLPSYLDLAEQTISGGPQRQHRWWFVGHFDAIRHTADKLAFEFEGNALRVDTAPTQTGSKTDRDAPKPSRAAKRFAELATKSIPELAAKIPSIAQLQNLVSLSVAAVLIRQQADAQRQADREGTWRPAHFLDDAACPVERFAAPRQTASLANVRFVKNQFWLFSISGGVAIDPEAMAEGEHLKPAAGARLQESRAASAAPAQSTRWWWD
jgi:hypothetical protein